MKKGGDIAVSIEDFMVSGGRKRRNPSHKTKQKGKALETCLGKRICESESESQTKNSDTSTIPNAENNNRKSERVKNEAWRIESPCQLSLKFGGDCSTLNQMESAHEPM